MNSVLEKESSVLERSDIKDINLAEQGKNNIEWALKDMPVLRKIEERFIKEQPFKGLKLSACVHITKETAALCTVASLKKEKNMYWIISFGQTKWKQWQKISREFQKL